MLDALAPDDARTRARRQGRNLSANVFALTASQLVTWLMTLIWTLVVPRALGPDQMGLLVSAVAITSILGVVLGLPTRDYLVREIVAVPNRADRLTSTTMILRVGLVPLFYLAVTGYAAFAGFSGDRLLVLYLMTGVAVLSLLAEPSQAIFQAVERMQYIAYSEVMNKTVSSIAGVLLTLVGIGVVGLTVSALV